MNNFYLHSLNKFLRKDENSLKLVWWAGKRISKCNVYANAGLEYRVMINEIAMVLMFAALFILLLSAVIVGSRTKKATTQPAPETMEEPPKEPPKTREPLAEERPSAEVEPASASMDVFEDEEQYTQAPEQELLMPELSVEIPGLELEAPEQEFLTPEQSVEIPGLGLEAPEMEVEFSEPEVELPEPEIEESVPEIDEEETEALEPEVVLPEPVLLDTPKTEEPAVDELTFEDTYRETDYFKDEDVIPIQGVTTCPHCGEKVPATIYCINCGKSLNG